MARVLAIGPVFVDSIYGGLPRIPEAGQEVYGGQHLVTVGGYAITAIGMARLGLSPVIVSAVGDDLFGKFVEERLQREGVSTDGLVRVAGKSTSHSTAMVLEGDRRFVSYAGAELSATELLAHWVSHSPEPFAGYKLMHVGLMSDQELYGYLEQARKAGVLISMSTGWPAVEEYRDRKAALAEALSKADFFFCNELEAQGLSGKDTPEEALYFFKEIGCHPVVTLGEQGALTFDEAGKIIREPALDVEFVDPTGAGDSFAVGFVTGVILGWPLARALKLGIVCGSLSVTALGGTEAYPSSLETAISRFSDK